MAGRIVAVVVMLVAPALVAGQEKEKEKPKRAPSFIGVQIAKTKDAACAILVVTPDGPAAKAGLKGGDLILRIDGTRPADLETTVKVIRSLKPGKKVKFVIRRDGEEKTIEVTPVAVTG